MQTKIEHLLPAALDAVDQVLVEKYGRERIPAGYQGAISGFGTSLIQMGLLPTLAVYTDQDSAASIERPLLLKTLFTILKSEESRFSAKSSLPAQHDNLLRDVSSGNYQKELKTHLMHAALALKLAIRTYKLVNNNE